MSDYIKREDAIFVALQQPLYSVVSQIKQLEGIDIVRCKDCKRWWGNHWHDNEDGKCPMDAWIDGDGFCSYGERRE